MRSEVLTETFVEIVDALVADFDIVDFLQGLTDRCVQMLDVDAAGLLLVDEQGRLEAVAATSGAARLLELLQLEEREGPGLECFRSGGPVTIPDVGAVQERWPRFALACQGVGFASVNALPMQRREQVIGTVNLFRVRGGGLEPDAIRIAHALTAVATIAVLLQRVRHDQQRLVEQLQTALTSRVAIEQAKGVLAERWNVDPEQAFVVLRRHARRRNIRLTDLARAVVSGGDDLTFGTPGR